MPVPNVTGSLHSSDDMLDLGTLDGSGCGAKAVTSTSTASTSCCAVPDSLSDCSDESNVDRLQEAVETILVGLGEDVQREGLRDTPKRVAKAWLDASQGYRQEVASVLGSALFHEPSVLSAGGGLVVVRDVEFASTSEHDLLPFYGRCHIGYVPGQGVVLGLSKVARLAKLLASRLQTQEQLTQDIVMAFQQEVLPQGAAVVVEARHLSEGPGAPARVTTAACGCFDDPRQSHMEEFLTLLSFPTSSSDPCASARGTSPAAACLCSTSGPHGGPHGPRYSSHACSSSLPESILSNNPDGHPGLVFDARLPECDTFVHPSEVYMRQSSYSAPAERYRRRSSDLHRDKWRQAMIVAVTTILHELGEDVNREGLCGSAERYVNHLLTVTAGASAVMPSFLSAPSLAPGIQVASFHFASLCEHHLLPFHGTVHIAYRSTAGSPSPSPHYLQAVVEVFARRLQVQERLTQQLADAVSASVGSGGVLVVCEAVHMCMVARGVEKHASSTLTMATTGKVSQDADLRREVIQRVVGQGRTQGLAQRF